VGVDQLARFADEFVARLFAAGRHRTTIQGIAAPETVVEVPSIQLCPARRDDARDRRGHRRRGPTPTRRATSPAAARVRTGTEKRALADEIAGIVLRSEPRRLDADRRRCRDGAGRGVDRERAYFVGDNRPSSIRVDRSEQGDAIRIQRAVEEVAAEMGDLPAGVTIDLIRTRAEAITGRLNILLTNGLMGLGLVVAAAVPVPQRAHRLLGGGGHPRGDAAAIAMMYAAGLTFNMISLFALIITLGIVVDDAIVVGEHADFRARRLGEAAGRGGRERRAAHGLPVFAATLTTSSPSSACRGRRAVRRPDRRHPLHRDRGADRLASNAS
jgi:hypothetical protein